MKPTIFLAIMAFCTLTASAQESNFDEVMQACITLRDAAAAQNSAALKKSASQLRDYAIADFSTLSSTDTVPEDALNGHLVFDEAFADSLAKGKKAYRTAADINRKAAQRGQSPSGAILTKTCFVKAEESIKYSFSSRGHQDLAVVAEAGGRVTMKILVTNSAGLSRRYDDTKDVKKGQPHRKTSFDLPTDRRNIVELEVVNCSQKDISFVVISN